MDFCDLMNINVLSMNFDLRVKYCEEMVLANITVVIGWKQNLWDKYI